MGNYPYSTSYILNGNGELPPFPMRVACESLSDPDLDADGVLRGLAEAVGVYYNNSRELTCFDYSQGVNPDSSQDALYWGTNPPPPLSCAHDRKHARAYVDALHSCE